MPLLQSQKSLRNTRRKQIPVPGIDRGDSDDELGDFDYPWEWVFDEQEATEIRDKDDHEGPLEPAKYTGQTTKRPMTEKNIIGARMGDFVCYLGDTVLLKAEGCNEAWAGLICDFIDDDGSDGSEKSAHFMWFSTEKEIRNKTKKRTDFLPVSLIC